MKGIDKFREYFKEHSAAYVLIGGTACDLLFTDAGLPYRATKDIDIVLCVEVVDAALAKQFAAFIDAADYEVRAMHDGEKKFYRFAKPKDAAFPAMIELFARPRTALGLPDTDKYVRLSVEEDIISLSALLLDENYYALLQSGRSTIDEVSIANEDILIPFKARAFLDLTSRKAGGGQVDSKDIEKHRNDVFRLLQLVPGDRVIALTDPVKADLNLFVAAMTNENVDPKSFKVPITKEEGVAALQRAYGL
jgi:hypothetical protein